jgi:organic radical activating enzyme
MQYYQHPENLDVDDMIDKFGRFLESIDMLLELRILGGEPFICRDLDKVIHAFLDHDKVKRITIYTNSTIIPSDTVLDALKNPKVSVHMSNYGMVSRNVEKLDKIFTENGINHYIHVYDQWSNLGGLDKRNYCAERLNAIKNAGNEFVDFNCTIDNRQKRQALKALIENTEYIQRVIIAMAPRQDVNR